MVTPCCALTFQTNGDLLLAIDDSDRHVMSVWEWTREDLDQPSAKTTVGCYWFTGQHRPTQTTVWDYWFTGQHRSKHIRG